jgi:PST family polysaccharide transporter
MSPNWFFQGIEKMEFIAIIDVVAKVIFTGSIFLLIRQESDYIYILPLWGMGGLITAFAGLYLIIVKYSVRLRWVGLYTLYKGMKKSYFLFMSNLAIHTIYNSNIIILGLLQNPEAVGIYAIADKVIKIPWTLATLFSHAIYPRVCIINKSGFQKVLDFYKKILPLPYIGFMLMLGLIWLFKDQIVYLLSNLQEPRISNLMNLLLVCVIIVILNTPFYHYLLANEKDKQLMKIFLLTTVFSLSISFILIYYYSFWGAAIAGISTLSLMLILLVVESVRIVKYEKSQARYMNG